MQGSFWFGALFGKLWVAELKTHNVIITPPTSKSLAIKMALTFFANIVGSFALAILVKLTLATTIQDALILGTIVTGIIVAATIPMYVWQGKSSKLFIIDAGYPITGSFIATLILTLWR
jgi:fluoride ion exporter CrcB/FEX